MKDKWSNFKLILTGEIGVGKTACVKNLVNRLEIPFSGFTTDKVTDDGDIIGFCLTEIGGESRTFAHINYPKTNSFSKYGIDYSVFRDFGREVLNRSLNTGKMILIDELGTIEQKEPLFCEKVKEVIRKSHALLTVIQKRAIGFWLRGFNDIDPFNIFEVTPENRDNIVEKIIEIMELKQI